MKIRISNILLAFAVILSNCNSIQKCQLYHDEVEKEQILGILKEDRIFDNLYKYEYSLSIDLMDTVEVLLAPNQMGKYMTLVNKLASESELFMDLKKSFEKVGGPVESFAIILPNGHHVLDFNDEKIRLILAINILSLDAPEKFSTQH